MVHAELMTHRLFSRNSASSRAIPNERLVKQVLEDPAMPVWWGKNQSGMQAREALSDEEPATCRACGDVREVRPFTCCSRPSAEHDLRSDRRVAADLWLLARDKAVDVSRELAAAGLHKQICNRVIEPWMFITVIVSSTEHDNWFALRDHPDAQPEIAWVARRMRELFVTNEPRCLAAGEWHLPLVDRWNPEHAQSTDRGESLALEAEGFAAEEIRRISVGRCARVSYLTHDGRRAPREDLALADRLAGSSPGHWSPFEHVAMALEHPTPSGNFAGWRQFRKEFAGEHAGDRRQ
jgi:hypothetical protein